MWNALQCAVQGRGHLKSGTPCQDKTFYLYENDINVIALADGAGSVKMSHFGAEYVTKKICELLSTNFDTYYAEADGATIKRVIIGYLLEGLEELSSKLDCTTSDLASTLLAVAIHNDKYIVIHIGDGVIGYIKNNDLKIASHPENGEFVNTTVFVTSKVALSTMKMMKGRLNGITGFALMSDGTETSLYNKRDKSLAPILKKLMDLSQVMNVSCLQSEIEKSFAKVIKNATTDDCSIALLVEEDYHFLGYNCLTTNEKIELFNIKKSISNKKRIKRYDNILKFTIVPKNLSQISKKIYVKKKYCRKYVDILLKKNLIVKDKGYFCTAVIMNK